MGQNVFTRPSTERRVVVTGLGAITPVGRTVDESWDSLLHGRSGIGKITSFDATGFPCQVAGEIKGFEPTQFIEKKEIKKMARFIQLAMACTEEALNDSGLAIKDNEVLRARTGCLLGVGMGGLAGIEKQFRVYDDKGPGRVSPFFIPSVITNMAPGHVSIKHGLRGPNYALSSACASGAHAIASGARYIQKGLCDAMVVGGCESTVTDLGVGGFAAMKALSRRNDQPTLASRPFDKDRDGFVLSEGAGILIIEDLEHAQRRGAKIYGELTGYGTSSDAYHMTAGLAEGQALSIRLSLQDAGLNPEDIGYINAHGTSTPVGDVTETQSLKSVFGDHCQSLWISSTKSMTGHTLGAAGAIESVFSLKTLQQQVAPPTINLDNPSPECDLDYVPHTARDGKFEHVLNNSFGFGGTNCSLIFSKMV